MNASEAPEEFEIDDEEHCDSAHNLVNCNDFYEVQGGSFKGKMTWCKTIMGKLRNYYGENSFWDH